MGDKKDSFRADGQQLGGKKAPGNRPGRPGFPTPKVDAPAKTGTAPARRNSRSSCETIEDSASYDEDSRQRKLSRLPIVRGPYFSGIQSASEQAQSKARRTSSGSKYDSGVSIFESSVDAADADEWEAQECEALAGGRATYIRWISTTNMRKYVVSRIAFGKWPTLFLRNPLGTSADFHAALDYHPQLCDAKRKQMGEKMAGILETATKTRRKWRQ